MKKNTKFGRKIRIVQGPVTKGTLTQERKDTQSVLHVFLFIGFRMQLFIFCIAHAS